MTLRTFCAAAALCGSALLAACDSAPQATSQDTMAPDTVPQATSQIEVSAPWSRETAMGQDAGGAFMTITNTGEATDRLVGGSTPVAGEVQVHTVDMTDGIMRMRQLADGLEIPAGETVTLKPGSFHIMLMQLQEPLAQGTTVPLTLTFEQAGDMEVELAVQPIGTEAPVEADHG